MPFDIRTASLRSLRALFASLPPPSATQRHGFFRASFVGPALLRWSAPPSLALSGLPGWQGKRFRGPETATNVVLRANRAVEAMTMQVVSGLSQVDGQPGVALHYLPEAGRPAPIPWRWVRDELRVLDDDTWLCMTVINLPLLRRLSFPFVLRREGAAGSGGL